MDGPEGDAASEGGELKETRQRVPIPLAALQPDKEQLWWVLAWCFAAFGAFCATNDRLLLLFFLLPMGAVALGLIVSGLWRGWELRRTPMAALLTVILMPAAIACVSYLGRAATWLDFLQDKDAYEEIVARVNAEPLDVGARSEGGSIEYRVDRSGGATRIAFVTDAGMADNWAAIIHDPTGSVALARGHDTAPKHVQELFRGSLVSCWRLNRHFYSCSFS